MRDLSKEKDSVVSELKNLLEQYGYSLNLHDSMIERIFLGSALRYTNNDYTYGMELAELIKILRKGGNICVKAPTCSMTINSNELKSALLEHLDYLFDYYILYDPDENNLSFDEAYKMIQNGTKSDKCFYGPKLPAKRYGFQLAYVTDMLKQYGVFSEKQNRKEFCFLYDYMTILGQVEAIDKFNYKGDSVKDKADTIRDWMKAYNAMKNKKRGKN